MTIEAKKFETPDELSAAEKHSTIVTNAFAEMIRNGYGGHDSMMAKLSLCIYRAAIYSLLGVENSRVTITPIIKDGALESFIVSEQGDLKDGSADLGGAEELWAKLLPTVMRSISRKASEGQGFGPFGKPQLVGRLPIGAEGIEALLQAIENGLDAGIKQSGCGNPDCPACDQDNTKPTKQ